MGKWERPESVPIPIVWRRFEGKKPLGKNGKIPKFKVQDFTEDLREAVLDQMIKYYLGDEPKAKAIKLTSDPVAVQDYRIRYSKALDQKLALVCLLENSDELGDETLPVLAGCNLTYYATPDYELSPISSERARPLQIVTNDCFSNSNCYERFKVDGFMCALGLTVDPTFRGQGIGLEIVKARFDLARAVGIKLTITLFSSTEAQNIAEKAGFETIYERDYSTYKDEQGNLLFNGVKTKSIKFMAARIE